MVLEGFRIEVARLGLRCLADELDESPGQALRATWGHAAPAHRSSTRAPNGLYGAQVARSFNVVVL
jgi:hypothetical protein